jgi:ParB-like chromosome segregation protein Spo0J
VPILIDEANVIIAGHGRVLAAEQLGIGDVPVAYGLCCRGRDRRRAI